jgi:hypothetical protein
MMYKAGGKVKGKGMKDCGPMKGKSMPMMKKGGKVKKAC